MSADYVNPFTPDQPIQLTRLSDLVAFEDVVAHTIDPDMTAGENMAWQGRSSLKDFIRPPKFNGRLANLELIPLENPYAKMRSLREDGWRLTGVGSTIPGSSSERDIDYRAERCIGFYLIANAESTGRGTIGEVQVGLWYLPVPRMRNSLGRNGLGKQSASYGGRSVLRVVTQPRLEAEAFKRLNEESTRIALSALTRAMQHPLRIGMHN